MLEGMEKEIPPHWMGYINVADLDASAQKAESLGATVKAPPKRSVILVVLQY
jgi:predicted enzyme related to lactoylglutathione lyase